MGVVRSGRRRAPWLVVGLLATPSLGCSSDPGGASGSGTVLTTTTTPRPLAGQPRASSSEPGGSTTGAPPSTLTPFIPGLSAVLEQYREDELNQEITVKARNATARPIRIESLRLSWPGFRDTAAAPLGLLLSPGQRLDLTVPLGESVCSAPPRADEQLPAEAAVAHGTALVDDRGPPVAVAIPVVDELGILARIYPRDCRRQRIEWALSAGFGSSWSEATGPDGEPELVGTLRVDRGEAAGALTVTALLGSVLLAVVPLRGGDPVLELVPEAATTEVPVAVRGSGACEPHQLAESKKTFILPILVSIDGETPIAYDLTVDDATKQRMNRMILQSCGLPTG